MPAHLGITPVAMAQQPGICGFPAAARVEGRSMALFFHGGFATPYSLLPPRRPVHGRAPALDGTRPLSPTATRRGLAGPKSAAPGRAASQKA